jgi:hypothetical protein
MRTPTAAVLAALAALAAGAAQAQDSQLSCKGVALVMPDETNAPLDVRLTVKGGLDAPESVAYAWARPEPSVAMPLAGLLGDKLMFHASAPTKDGAVLVADATLNRQTLALVLKVRRVGDQAQDVTLETTCQKG